MSCLISLIADPHFISFHFIRFPFAFPFFAVSYGYLPLLWAVPQVPGNYSVYGHSSGTPPYPRIRGIKLRGGAHLRVPSSTLMAYSPGH